MKKIKVIDLLNKIANGEDVPEKIIYKGNHYYNVGNKEQAYYENTELDDNLLLYAIHNEGHLNDEIEIIEDTPKEIYFNKEDKKIEKLVTCKSKPDPGNECYKDVLESYDGANIIIKEDVSFVIDKVNEIIDVVNKLNGQPPIININTTPPPIMQGPYKITCSTSGKESDKQ